MLYLIDGYNILFSLEDAKDLQHGREELIEYLSRHFKSLNLSGILVFDGAHRRDEESGRNYASPLETVFSPRGQNADSYIVEQIEGAKNPKDVTVITNDTGLKRRARELNAHVQPTKAFIRFLEKKATKKPNEKDSLKESPKNLERLLKIFEDRFHGK